MSMPVDLDSAVAMRLRGRPVFGRDACVLNRRQFHAWLCVHVLVRPPEDFGDGWSIIVDHRPCLFRIRVCSPGEGFCDGPGLSQVITKTAPPM